MGPLSVYWGEADPQPPKGPKRHRRRCSTTDRRRFPHHPDPRLALPQAVFGRPSPKVLAESHANTLPADYRCSAGSEVASSINSCAFIWAPYSQPKAGGSASHCLFFSHHGDPIAWKAVAPTSVGSESEATQTCPNALAPRDASLPSAHRYRCSSTRLINHRHRTCPFCNAIPFPSPRDLRGPRTPCAAISP